jgi:nitrite reductase (NADH) large subunit
VSKSRLSIIGNGMATGRLLDDLLRRDALSHYEITVFGEEPHGCYNRILLSRILSEGSPDEIMLKPNDWYAACGVRYQSSTRVTKVDAEERRLTTADGNEHPYDVVIFATGSSAMVPPVQGLAREDGTHKHGVFVFRTIEDCQRIRAYTRPASNAVVVGGGLLGLEAAKGLSDRGLHVTVVHLAETLMNTQLDKIAGEMLRRAIERLGIFVRTGRTTQAVIGEERVEGVRFDDRSKMPTDLVVFACGIRPRVEVARESKIPVNRGILVNDVLATSVPGVYAVGECAEHRGQIYGIVQPIWEQCAILADVLTGVNPQARYRGSKLYTRLKIAGVEVASMGLSEAEQETDEVIQIIEDRKATYRKLIVRDNRLAGATLVGNADAAGTLVQLFERGDPLPANRLDLFASADAGSGAPTAVEICNCHHVNEATLAEAIQSGCKTLPELSARTKAGTGCGSCRGQLASLLMRHGKGGTNGDHTQSPLATKT